MLKSDVKTAREIALAMENAFQRTRPLTAESMRRVRREYTRYLASASPRIVIATGRRLIRSPEYYYRVAGYELIHYHRPALQSLRARQLEGLGGELGSWGDVDVFAGYLSGPAWREGQVSDRTIRRWAKSKSRWWRRAALVSTVPLNVPARGGHGDAARTLDVCERLIDDRDDMVVKALSWALRELVRHDPQSVQTFINRHRDRLAARVIREVTNKLTTGVKNSRR